MAIAITDTVYTLHRQQEIIGTLSPANCIVGTDAAVIRLAEIGENNEAYRAPEQTGRIEAIPDHRSDLYTLGAMFYEMFSGELPFQRQGKEDWGYVHLAVTPRPIAELRKDLPPELASIVMKLLRKTPQERYQSAYGLLYDLRRYASSLGEDLPASFELGRMDQRRLFQHPVDWYGEELHTIISALETARSGENLAISVTGESGTGKTLLASELKRIAQEKRIVCLAGSGDAEYQHEAYYALGQAIDEWLLGLWLAEACELEQAKQQLQQALDADLPLLAAWLPAARLLFANTPLAPLPEPSILLPQLDRLLTALCRCIVEMSGRLIIIMDNAQWLDSSTKAILGSSTSQQPPADAELLMLIAGDTDISSSTQVTIHRDNLHFDGVRRWVSALMHEDSPRIRMLARFAYGLTGGHAGALRHLLDEWHHEQKLYYNEQQHEWAWDLALMGQSDPNTGAGTSLMEEARQRLSNEERHAVSVAAIIGDSFELSILADIYGFNEKHVFGLLSAAEREGWVCEIQQHGETVTYAFLDEQIRLVMAEELALDAASWHLKIGKSMQKRGIYSHNERLYPELLRHLMLGSSEMSESERYALVKEHFEVGKKHYDLYQFTEATHYLDFVVSQFHDLNADHEPFVYQAWLYLAVCEHYGGDIEGSRKRYETLYNHVDRFQTIDRVQFYRFQISHFTFMDDKLAVHYGEMALNIFGWSLPAKVTKLGLLKEIVLTQQALRRTHNKEISFKHNSDPEYAEFCSLILIIVFPLMGTNPSMILWLLTRFIRYGLNQGINGLLLCIIGSYEIMIQRVTPGLYAMLPSRALDYLQSVSYANDPSEQYRVPYVVALYKQLEDAAETPIYLQKAMRRGLRYGDSLFTSHALTTFIVTYNGKIQALEDQLLLMENDERFVLDAKVAERIQSVKQYCLAMRDAETLFSFIQTPDEAAPVAEDNYFCIAKLELSYLSGHYQEAVFWAREGKRKELSLDWVQNRRLRLYEALTYVALHANSSPSEQAVIQKLLKKRIRQMGQWKGLFGTDTGIHLLLKGEYLRITGKAKKAQFMLESAVSQAKRDGHGLIEGICHERLAAYYEQTGSSGGATVSLVDACAAYSDWGVLFKEHLLKEKHPHLLWYLPEQQIERNSMADQQKIQRTKLTNAVLEPQSDEHWLQEIASWLVSYERNVFGQFLLTTLRQVSGDRGFIFRAMGSEFQVEASWDRNQNIADQEPYALSVLRQVQMTQGPVMTDVAYPYDVKSDTQEIGVQLRSVMAMPIQLPNEQEPLILYLENRHLASAFHKKSLNIAALLTTRLVYLMLLDPKQNGTEVHHSGSANESSLIEPISSRELEVLLQIAEGLSNKEIAERLGITETTVKKHVSNMYGKLGVKRRGQAIARARELNLIH